MAVTSDASPASAPTSPAASARAPKGEPHPLIGWSVACAFNGSKGEEWLWVGEIRAVVTTATEVGNCAVVEITGSGYSQLYPLTEFTKTDQSDDKIYYRLFPSVEARTAYAERDTP